MNYKIKGEPWNIQGSIDVSDCKTSEEVIEKSGLNYTVKRGKLFVESEINNIDALLDAGNIKSDFIRNNKFYKNIENQYANYRTDTGQALGIITDKYEIIQNVNAFNFFDDAIGEDSIKWERAGNFDNGKKIFVSAKLKDNILVKGDKCDNYLVFTNSHDGKSGVTIMFTPIRIICKNTLRAAIKQSNNFIRFRHTSNVQEKFQQGIKILDITKEKIKETSILFNQLSEIKVTDVEVKNYILKNILENKELNKLIKVSDNKPEKLFTRNYYLIADSEISTNKLNTICKIYDYYQNGIGQNSIAGTAWGAYNSITGYYSNVDNINGEKRLNSLLYGNRGTKINNALLESTCLYK